MARKPSLEETIEVASRMKEYLQAIYVAYEKMPLLIKKEHEAISHHKLAEVEKIAEEKTRIGSEMEKLFADIKLKAERLSTIHDDLCGTIGAKADSISDCISLFEAVSANFKERGFGAQVFDHVLKGFKDVFQNFIKLRDEVRPIIERNKYVLGKVLHQRQENFRFWQEVIAESMASYNPEGKQKTKHNASILAVKA